MKKEAIRATIRATISVRLHFIEFIALEIAS